MRYDIDKDFLSLFTIFKVDFSKPLIVKALNLLFKLSFQYGSSGKGLDIYKKQVKTPSGSNLNLVIYKPQNLAENAPCLIYSHGGGFFLTGSLMSRKAAIFYAKNANCVVIYVDYRLSLENPYPAALEDAYTALCWASENAKELGIDKNKIGVAGESAGGALSALISQKARDENKVKVCCQLLIYPVIDNELKTNSMQTFTDTLVWDKRDNEIMWERYLKNINLENSAYIAPMRAESFANLPPIYIETAEYDPVRDEGIEYARRLAAAGVKVELNETKRTFHGYDVNFAHEKVKIQLQKRINFLNSHFQNT